MWYAHIEAPATRLGWRDRKVEPMLDRNFASTCKLEESSPEGLEVLPHEQ